MNWGNGGGRRASAGADACERQAAESGNAGVRRPVVRRASVGNSEWGYCCPEEEKNIFIVT